MTRAFGTPGRLVAALAAAVGMSSVAALHGQPPAVAPAGPAAATGAAAGDDLVATRHEIKAGDQALKYTAHAGLLPIRHNETGEVRGKVFFVAYVLDRPPGAPVRPLTFLWNGGPGANATLVHLSGFGPRRITPGGGPAGSLDADWKLEDNETTWLDQADLVFVDPVGTGFSRPSKAEYGADFYNTLGDIDSVAEFVRVYLTRFDAWDAPLLVGGESYGVWRAAGVAETLLRRGRKVAGVILISGGVPVGPVVPDEMRTALFVPTRTAAAFHHKKLPPDLQADRQRTLTQAEEWARTAYAPALAMRERLGDAEREDILKQLARFTGLDPSLIDPRTLTVGRQQFADQLLKTEGRVLARFDTHQTANEEKRPQPGRQRVITRYLRSTLLFKTDLAYLGIEQGFAPAAGGKRGQPVLGGTTTRARRHPTARHPVRIRPRAVPSPGCAGPSG
jgi:carboxypeptidase C (cathepsin A)